MLSIVNYHYIESLTEIVSLDGITHSLLRIKIYVGTILFIIRIIYGDTIEMLLLGTYM